MKNDKELLVKYSEMLENFTELNNFNGGSR
jgi:hypothetical protein